MPQMKSKRPKESNLPERKHTSKDILNKISWIRLLKGSSLSMRWNQNISHRKGHYGWKNLSQISNKEINPWRLKAKKSKTIKRMQKAWNEEQKNIYVHTLLQSCGV